MKPGNFDPLSGFLFCENVKKWFHLKIITKSFKSDKYETYTQSLIKMPPIYWWTIGVV
jgi:hypothetical protein